MEASFGSHAYCAVVVELYAEAGSVDEEEGDIPGESPLAELIRNVAVCEKKKEN